MAKSASVRTEKLPAKLPQGRGSLSLAPVSVVPDFGKTLRREQSRASRVCAAADLTALFFRALSFAQRNLRRGRFVAAPDRAPGKAKRFWSAWRLGRNFAWLAWLRSPRIRMLPIASRQELAPSHHPLACMLHTLTLITCVRRGRFVAEKWRRQDRMEGLERRLSRISLRARNCRRTFPTSRGVGLSRGDGTPQQTVGFCLREEDFGG